MTTKLSGKGDPQSQKPPKPKRPPREQLLLARRLTDKMRANPLVQQGAGVSLKIEFKEEQLSTTLAEPDPYLFESLLLDARKFLMPSEELHVLKLPDLAARHIADAELVHAIESAVGSFEQDLEGKAMRLEINGVVVTPADAAGNALYADYFHTDYEKELWLKSQGEIGQKLVRNSFIDLIIQLTKAMMYIGSCIQEAEVRGALVEDPLEGFDAHPHQRWPAVEPEVPLREA